MNFDLSHYKIRKIHFIMEVRILKTAVIGSRGIPVGNLGQYLPSGTTETVYGGAKGVDAMAREYADMVLAFWDGNSCGMQFVIKNDIMI